MALRTTAALAAGGLLFLSACGGGGGGSTNVAPPDNPWPNVEPDPITTLTGEDHEVYSHYEPIELSALDADDAVQMPIYQWYFRNGRSIFVGIHQAGSRIASLPTVTGRGDTAIRHGRLADRAGRRTVSDYLAEVVDRVARYESSPVVRVLGATSAHERQLVIAAVQLVNAALPEDHKMSVGAPLAFSLRHTVNSAGEYLLSGQELDNTIHVEFMPCSAYFGCGRYLATAFNHWNDQARGSVAHTYIQLSQEVSEYDRQAIILLAHEFLHALGLYSHPVSSRFSSILEASAAIYYPAQEGMAQPLSLLYPVDREALRVLHSRLENGDRPTSFGPWASTSLHIAGTSVDAAFGVAIANGYAEPWAYGRRPWSPLADNPALAGAVVWDGTLVGLTPAANAVTGNAKIEVDLSTMDGSAEFTELEAWEPWMAPGEAGSGTQWLDGDLAYAIAVRGNTFKRTGGDDGTLTGIFVGRQHEGAAGTLERADLTAAFGASRE